MLKTDVSYLSNKSFTQHSKVPDFNVRTNQIDFQYVKSGAMLIASITTKMVGNFQPEQMLSFSFMQKK